MRYASDIHMIYMMYALYIMYMSCIMQWQSTWSWSVGKWGVMESFYCSHLIIMILAIVHVVTIFDIRSIQLFAQRTQVFMVLCGWGFDGGGGVNTKS